ncbi:hypothetical protein GCM10010269_23900 [Streptomyces humidus]|uniref:Uncharacterized protein n=1 Tax=Streptomyces humidus TaxID=52259 RepID=A0A918FUP1_9ACTN|nr:V-type ATP synthase subunit E [Streptomyces humidus]GGR83988.1 hypothetical protein GCM10010269_23900 [Streptomyces humidus]
MTAAASDRTANALHPVRTGLLRAAHADAEALLARADREAASLVEQARSDARALVAEARRQGEADGADSARDLLVRARREARSRTLGARREAYGRLRREAAERVGGLCATEGYAALRERLEQRARALLGPGAEVTGHADGGVVARTPGRRVDLSLTELADRALDRMGGEVRRLWEP